MRRLLAVALMMLVAACSSGKRETKPPPSTTLSTSTSSSALASSTTTAPTTTVPPASTTIPVTTPSSVRVTAFSYVGTSPVECNAPTSIELKWTTAGASTVDIFIDGGPRFARYPNGPQDELLPLACDAKTHTYKVIATAPGARASKSITVMTKKTG